MLTPSTLLITAVVTVVLVGGKRLRSLGEDLGAALKNFRQGLQGETSTVNSEKQSKPASE